MVERLDKRLYDSDSQDVMQWQKLGRSYLVLGEIDKSNKAYQKAYDLDNNNNNIQYFIKLQRLYYGHSN
jgi:cytochrome c-type biogenesis protein CcmH/NrfG